MEDRIMVVAPHPDDESLGCAGTLLRARAEGASLHWVIVTKMSRASGHSPAQSARRRREIAKVAKLYPFASTHELGFSSARLDDSALPRLIAGLGRAVSETKPTTLLLPYEGDAHSDHGLVFRAGTACAKWFRYPSLRRVLAYETISETDFGLRPSDPGFKPNVFVNISAQLERKLAILKTYEGELGTFPFPRSVEAITALARVRGAASGHKAAEAFLLLRERS